MSAKLAKSLAVAFVITLGLEFIHGLRLPWPGPITRIIGLQTGVFALGVVLVWAFVVFFQAVFNCLWISAAIVSSVAVLIGVADLLKLLIRGEPLFLSDAAFLPEVGFLIDNIGAGLAIAIFSALAAIPITFWWVNQYLRKRRQKLLDEAEDADLSVVDSESSEGSSEESSSTPKWRRRRPPAKPSTAGQSIFARIVTATAALLVIVLAGTFNLPGNPARAAWELAGARWKPWNQQQNYDDNGLITGLLYTLPSTPMMVPEGYSEQAMNDLVARWQARADELNVGRDPNALAGVNVVVVLEESFSDPMVFPDVVTEDPIPYMRSLMETNPSGTLLSGGYAGGTASMEFETITGMALSNMLPQVDSPYQSIVQQMDYFPSYVTAFKKGGRYAAAIHPYKKHFYARIRVYPTLGFDSYRFEDDLQGLAHLPGDAYISDGAVFEETLNTLRQTDQPMFINLVTMQNHSPQEGLLDPWPVTAPLNETRQERAEQYLSGLSHTDQALQQFVEGVNALDEPTVVLLYGDHLPNVWSDEVIENGGPLARYQTPWVIFGNIPLNNDVHPGIIGANQLIPQLLDATNAPYTPWTALLHDLAQEVPAMERTFWVSPQGGAFSEQLVSERGQELLADYRMAQYDMISGSGWGTEAMYGSF